MQGAIRVACLEDGNPQHWRIENLPPGELRELLEMNLGSEQGGDELVVPQVPRPPYENQISLALLGGGSYRLTCACDELNQAIADNPGATVERSEDCFILTFDAEERLVA